MPTVPTSLRWTDVPGARRGEVELRFAPGDDGYLHLEAAGEARERLAGAGIEFVSSRKRHVARVAGLVAPSLARHFPPALAAVVEAWMGPASRAEAGRSEARARASAWLAAHVHATEIPAGCKVPRDWPGMEKLRPYQLAAVAWLARAGGRGILGDEMGLGKTASALGTVSALRCRRVLVVAPPVVTVNWAREAARFAPAYRVVQVKDGRAARAARRATDGTIEIASWGLVATGAGPALLRREYDAVIVDEAHRMASRAATGAIAVAALCHAAETRLLLTGTPISNRPAEAWHLAHAVDPLQWPLFLPHGEQFCGPRDIAIPGGGIARSYTGSSNLRELRDRLAPLVFRREKSMVARHLPARQWQHIEVEVEGVEDIETIARRCKGKTEASIGAELSRARERTGLAKVPDVLDLVSGMVAEGEPVVLFLWHRSVHDKLQAGFAALGIKTVSIHGGVTTRGKQAAVDAFQAGKAMVALCSSSAREGANLFRARTTVSAERFWVPAWEDQAEARVHREGQDRPCLHVYVHAAGSIDQAIDRAVEGKREVIGAILPPADHAQATRALSSWLSGGARGPSPLVRG